jgi:hypothetical protein
LRCERNDLAAADAFDQRSAQVRRFEYELSKQRDSREQLIKNEQHDIASNDDKNDGDNEDDGDNDVEPTPVQVVVPPLLGIGSKKKKSKKPKKPKKTAAEAATTTSEKRRHRRKRSRGSKPTTPRQLSGDNDDGAGSSDESRVSRTLTG